MAIAPISSVSFRNNYNQVNFEGKKREKSSGLHVSSSIKAIPLATLIALSPLNTVDADAQVRNTQANRIEVVQAKTYDNILADADKPIGLKFRYINSDSDSQTIENIKADSQELFDFVVGSRRQIEDADVKSINNYELSIVGADGNSVGTIRHSQLELRGMPNDEGRRRYYPIANEEIVRDFMSFANSDRNNGAVQIRNVKNTLYAAPGKMPSTYNKVNTSWMTKTNQGNFDFGTLLKQDNLSTEKNNYTIRFYSSDGNNSDVETIVCEREDGVRFKIDGLRVLNLKVVAEESYDDAPMPLGCIDISWPNVGKFTIFDNELFTALGGLAQYKNFVNAVNLSQVDYNVIINSDGSLLKVNK